MCPADEDSTALHATLVAENQHVLSDAIKSEYDVIVCGAGTSGSVIAGRLAANPSINVLLLEAGGSDDVDGVTRADLWPSNLGSERDWQFTAEPDANLGQRALPLPSGKVLGGSSSINIMVWARGHRTDWDFYAEQAGNTAWNYENVLEIYRAVEDWQGIADPRRGTDGPVFVSPAARPPDEARLFLGAAAEALGVPSFDTPNGEMMESAGGAAISDLLIRNDRRVSIFRSYAYPWMDRPNLTVLTGAVVRRVCVENGSAQGVEFEYRGALHVVNAQQEVVLSAGAVGTPKVLLQSGIGDARQLRRHGITVQADLPGVGQNLQDHVGFPVTWEWAGSPPLDYRCLGSLYWPTARDVRVPQLFGAFGFGVPFGSPEALARFRPPQNIAGVFAAVSHPKSRGSVVLSGPDPDSQVRIVANALSDPDDFELTKAGIRDLQEIGHGRLGGHITREVMPTDLTDREMDEYIRQSVVTYWHQAGTAKMGTDAESVVDGDLRVHGVEKLRVAGVPVLPRLTAGNTMAPCVVIGELVSQLMLGIKA